MINKNRNQNNASNQMSSLLFPDINSGGKHTLHKSKFHKQNMHMLKQVEVNIKNRVIDAYKEKPKEWKLNQFQNVGSKIFDNVGSNPGMPGPNNNRNGQVGQQAANRERIYMEGDKMAARAYAHQQHQSKEILNQQNPSNGAPMPGQKMTKAQKMRMMMQQKKNNNVEAANNNNMGETKLTENNLQSLSKNQPPKQIQYNKFQPINIDQDQQQIIQMESQLHNQDNHRMQQQYGPISNSQSDQQLEGNAVNQSPDDYIQNIRSIGHMKQQKYGSQQQQQNHGSRKHMQNVEEAYQHNNMANKNQQQYGERRKPKAAQDNETIFGLVNQRSNSQNSLHRVPIQSRKQPQPMERQSNQQQHNEYSQNSQQNLESDGQDQLIHMERMGGGAEPREYKNNRYNSIQRSQPNNVQIMENIQVVDNLPNSGVERNKSYEPVRDRPKRVQPVPGELPPRKEAVPRAHERLSLKREQERKSNDKRNIVKDNMMKVILDNSAMVKKQQIQDKDDKSKVMETHKNYGKVPRYIQKYDRVREEKHVQRMIEEEKAKHPPGTRLMPEEERIETLKDLKESKKEINSAIEKLPVMSRTIAGEKLRRELEDKLVRIERAIETFEKKIVYVAF